MSVAPAGLTLRLLDATCRYVGGTWNEGTHDYRGGPIEGLGLVQRGRVKINETSFRPLSFAGADAMTSLMVVFVHRVTPVRESTPVGSGWLERTYALGMHLYTRTQSPQPVEAQDAVYELTDRVVAHLHADPTFGTGGWQADGSGLWFGEGQAPRPIVTVDYGTPSEPKPWVQQVVTLTGTATQRVVG